MSATKATIQAATGTDGTRMAITWATPPKIPPTWTIVMRTMAANDHTTQLAPRRGPGTRSKASSPVSPVAIV